ncbi:MAG TPA: ABC transporter permease subunit [Candidatus Limnocylindrales bacterium]|nr:ABC transporter permease subunit [Candidatus Limnocylindrales bacterium]
MPSRRPLARRARPVIGFSVIVLLLLMAWEGAKWVAGDPWRFESFLGTGIAINHTPPFRLTPFNDINLPHVWWIVEEFASVDARGTTTLAVLVGAGLFTLRNAAVGFAIGAVVGLGLAIVIVHVRFLERSLVPLLVVSQTIPIIAIAPLIVIGLRADWLGVAAVTSYLTFFPVTIAAIRGLRAFDPRAHELMTSYAADRRTVLWKLRLPSSTAYLFTAFKIAATGSIVGAIVGELPSGMSQGLARQILTGMQYYTLGPSYLWAAIVIASALGIGAFVLVTLVERWVLRDARPAESGAEA